MTRILAERPSGCCVNYRASGHSQWRVVLAEWFLTAAERGNPDVGPARLVRGQPGGAADPRRDLLRPPGHRGRGAGPGRLPVLHRLARRPRPEVARRRADRRRVVLHGRRARCRRQGTDVALASGQARRTARRRTSISARRSSGPAVRCCSISGSGIGGSHHQKLVVIRHPGRTRARRRVRRRHRPVPLAAATTTSHRGDPQAVRMSERYGEHPPWHDVQLRLRGPGRRRAGHHVPRTLERPGAAGHAVAARVAARTSSRGADLTPGPAAGAAARSAAVRPARGAGAADLSRRPCSNTTSRRTASAASPAATPRRSGGPGG